MVRDTVAVDTLARLAISRMSITYTGSLCWNGRSRQNRIAAVNVIHDLIIPKTWVMLEAGRRNEVRLQRCRHTRSSSCKDIGGFLLGDGNKCLHDAGVK